ncbi:hypothetical protein BH10BAC3_BH10BAC3_04050 [soil metagenome]
MNNPAGKIQLILCMQVMANYKLIDKSSPGILPPYKKDTSRIPAHNCTLISPGSYPLNIFNQESVIYFSKDRQAVVYRCKGIITFNACPCQY